ncbi:MAG: electron transfer flavoprotein subunit alpha/FixB family protein [Candidatus Aminicenantaceae bacterium]
MILVYIEVRDGKVKKSSLEALSEGKRRAGELEMEAHAVLAGHGLEGLAPGLYAYGAAKVHVLENTLLSHYSPSAYAYALHSLVEELQPQAFLFSATALGKDLAPRVAAKLGVGMASECTRMEVKEGRLEVVRPVFAGKAFVTFRLTSTPQIMTLRPNVFLVEEEGGSGETEVKEVVVPENQTHDRVIEQLREEGTELDVTEAEIIVSGGRGLKSPENFDLLRDLTHILPHSAVGASRSAVDSGWIDHQHQIGQTGKTVSPDLYLAFGLSGAIQHLAGMSSSKYIVVVNKDPDAPIFKVADFGVIGDLFEIIPHLKEGLKKALSE